MIEYVFVILNCVPEVYTNFDVVAIFDFFVPEVWFGVIWMVWEGLGREPGSLGRFRGFRERFGEVWEHHRWRTSGVMVKPRFGGKTVLNIW